MAKKEDFPGQFDGTTTRSIKRIFGKNYEKDSLKVVNGMGQVISLKKIELNGSNVAEIIEIGNVFPAGRYELKLEGVGMYISTAVLKN